MISPKNEPQYCEPDLSGMSESEQRLFILTKLSNPWWRLNHLYKIQNEKGELVTFRMRPAQRQLFRNMHNKNIILKARQLGFSTAIDIYLLDQALFTPHLKCGIVAQDKQAASEIFRTKIAVPFDNLPPWLRASFTVAERRSGASGGYNLDIPAFMRDPRFRDFTDEPTDVQKRLTRGNAPTAEELVHEQMAKGDAGPTDYELAERPRLPPPGDIHPGQGYPLPGEVRRMPDEPPAGRGGRYTTTGEVRGQSYEKSRQTVVPEGVQRQGETFPGEPSYRELPAPARQGLPRPEVAEPESPTAEPGNPSRGQERQAEAQRHEEEVAKKLAEKKERETQERNNAVRKHKERLSSYLDSVDEKSRDTARKFLHQGLNNPYGRGRLYISDLVEKRVDDGWRIKKDKDGRPQRLVGSNGESLGAGDITQYGLDYADHILRTEKSGEKIGDFGEVIHGAAKHRRAALAEALNTDKTIEDYHTQPLSKLFPEPDYEKMAAEGTDNRTLAMLALLRNMIPAKPRVPHRLNRWAKQVDDVRDTAGQLLDGSLPADKFIDRIRQERGSYYSEMVKTWEMLHRLPPAQMKQAAGYRVKSHAYSMVNGKEYNPPKVVHTLENEKGRSVLNAEDLNDLYKKAKAYFEQQSALPKSADSKTKLDIYQNRRTGEVFIAYGKNKTSLQGGFKTVAEARDYVKNNRAELLEKLNALREQSREEQRNASNRDRTGPDRREGDVTPEKFSGAFGFRGVQFGNYVEGPRRQSDLNRAYDSLMDMADVLKVPAKALSLNGRLGLAFGARGKGGKNAAAAHYEPGQVAINLTKGHGAGSLAHEWFHALDNYFGQYDAAREGEITSGDKFMTSNNKRWPQWNDKEKEYLHPVRQEVYDAFKGIVNAVHKSGMVNRARRLDEVRSKPYWATDTEMAARAFERYVQDRAKAAGVENDFLVNIRKADDHGSPETYAYPTDAELDGGIRRAFDNLFRTLKTRETDRGVAFYSRRGVKRTPEGNVISETGHSKEAKGSPVPQVKAVARTVMKRIKDIDLDVRVVKTQAEAAELAGESLDGYGKVHAFYRPEEREIVLVADNLPDGRTVREKLRHEIIHHALESVVTPAEYKTIVDNVLKTRDSDNAVIRETWRRVDADYGNESPEVQAGEFLAHMAEKHTPGKLSAAWNRVVALVKAVLRRTGLLQPSDLSDTGYIRDTLRTLGQRVREGYVPREGGDVSYSRAGKPDPFRVPEGEGERYRRDLAKMMSSLRSGDLKVDVGRTPPVLRHLGAPDLPVSISRDVVRKATNNVKHFVNMDTIEKLPELMHDPVAVYQSATQNNALVLWLDAVDRKGHPVLTAVHMNNERHLIEINRIASVYGPDNGMGKINYMEGQGLALYRNEKLSRDNPLYSGLQLPKGERSYHGLSDNVLSPDDIRKGPYYSRSTSDLSPEETLTGEKIRQVEDVPVPMAMMSDKYFTTRKDGKTYYIKLHDERLMRAMKNMGPETGNVVIQTLARVNRFLSSVNTTLNPEFLVSNFVRDMQTAVMNLKAEQGRDDGKLNGRDIAMKTVRDSGIAMKAVYASLRNKSLGGKGAEWQKTWKEFVEDGAKTGWFRMEDLNRQMKEMDRLVALAKGGWQGQGIQAWHSFFKLVEDGNNAVENALRLSAYKHARDAGLSRAQAASLAKNMTVNFNRRGEQGMLLNSLYMFANASIQGTANMMRSLAHLNGEGPLLQRLRWKNLNMAQKVALAATGAGYLIASLNRAGAGQDDDGVNWYDKVPDYVKEHNLVIMKSLFGGKPGEYWSIPLPYGYNMFFLLGGTAEGVIRGDLKATRAAGNIVGGLLGAFNPLGSEDSKTLTGTLLKNATPTIFRPAMDLAMNENFMGTQIYRENFPGGTPKPESTLGRRSTPEAYKVFADWLNRTSGGSQYRSGAVDINPDIMKYWIDYVSGGMGRFAGKTIDAAAKSYNGTDIPSQQIPFLGKISGQVLPYDDQQKMYDRIDELRQYDAELKTLRGADRTAFLNKYRGQISMNGIIHQTQSQLKNLRKQRDEIYSDPTLSAREQSQRVKAVELRMKAVTDHFNRAYREKVGD